MALVDVPVSVELQLKEIETIMLSSQVTTPFCITWSQDDKVLLLVEGGVYIFELWPTPFSDQQSVTFIKSWIPVSLSLPLSNVPIENTGNAFFWGLERKQTYETVVDSTLSSIIKKQNSSSNVYQIIQCEISPVINNKSYVACLTNHGQLDMFENKLKKWTLVLNVSELWIKYCKVETISKNTDFCSFKSKMYELKIVAMNWGEGPEVVFFTCHENGAISLWEVEVSSGVLKMNVKQQILVNGSPCTVRLISQPDSKLSFLFIGLLSGVVACFLIDIILGETKELCKVWENEDLISPNAIKFKNILGKLHVFTVKRHILLIQTVEYNADKFNVDATTWQEFPTTIVSFNEYQDDFIVCLENHDAYFISIKNGKVQSIQLIDIGVKLKQKTSYHCYGLALSCNRAIWILISSPKVNYDSSKEITHMILYSPQIKAFKSVTGATSCELIEKIVKQSKTCRISEISDLLELKKLELLSENSNFRESYELEKNCSLLELQLMLWEAKLKLFSNLTDTDFHVVQLESLIVEKCAQAMVSKLSESSGALTELQKKSLQVCQDLLKKDEQNRKISFDVCIVCGEDSYFPDMRMACCSNFHKFPRCCLSLLPCDRTPYVVCRNCDSVALNHFVTETECWCPFCDGLLELDSRLRGDS